MSSFFVMCKYSRQIDRRNTRRPTHLTHAKGSYMTMAGAGLQRKARTLLVAGLLLPTQTGAFVLPNVGSRMTRRTTPGIVMLAPGAGTSGDAGRETARGTTGRGEFLSSAAAAVVLGVSSAGLVAGGVPSASALVKGNAPPPGYNKKRGSGYGNGEAEASATAGSTPEEGDVAKTFSVTNSGIRFKDLKIGDGAEVKPTNVVNMRYRVEKLGKRSYDGISGETQSVFSLGYGEDDDKEGDTLTVPLGAGRLVSAVDEGVLGMRVGGVRRVAVRPERGWKKSDPKCATEIDMGVMSGVPGAALAKVEDCIDVTLEPRPVGYGATRRMARRFDETLIVEVELVGTKEGNGRIF
ncbi:unnamed protein product [Scytosiphon promiscuus]